MVSKLAFFIVAAGLLLSGCSHPSSPRRITADPDGRVIAVDAHGRRNVVGRWTAREDVLDITTRGRNSKAIRDGEKVLYQAREYVPCVLVNDDVVECNLLPQNLGPVDSSKRWHRSNSQAEPERTIRMILYSWALTNQIIPRLPPNRDRVSYIAEDQRFIDELSDWTGDWVFLTLTPMVRRRLKAGICQKPGACMYIDFANVSEHQAEVCLVCGVLERSGSLHGVTYQGSMNQTNGEWSLTWTTISPN
jgi:hypothetical protein